jgi:SAM-dependent methyltransferase
MPRVDNEEFYRTALAEHGETAEGVQWNSAETQQIRFQVLRQFLPADLSQSTIVDVGCGFGDLYCYFVQCGERPRRYIGIDVMEPMVEVAQTRTGCQILLCDVLTDPLPPADYYVCSGAMNILTRKETHRFIKNCFAACRVGFVFNLLKGRNTSFTYNFYQTSEIVQIAQEINANYRIDDRYMIGDFTTILIKNQSEI